ncbi:hypothetical protein B484DRAFT_408511, partial [Ochromonadaceae sp. CCMP2298]
VQLITQGHFAVAFAEGAGPDGLLPRLPFIVDPSVVFATDTTLLYPGAFFSTPVHQLLSPQGLSARTPCAFAAAKLLLQKGESRTITSVYGHSGDLGTFLGTISPK